VKQKSEDPRALVIGGKGFIGMHIVARLKQKGYFVNSASRNAYGEDLQHIQLDCSDYETVRKLLSTRKYDEIYHCAGVINQQVGEGQYRQMFNAITLPALNVVEAVHAYAPQATFVHVGSNAEYGVADCPQRVNDLCCPNSGYGAAKLAITACIQAKARSELFRALIIRPFFVYGPGAPPSNFVELMISAAQKSEPFLMTPGEQTRDFVPVDLLATWITDLPHQRLPWGSVVNGCLGQPIPIRELAERVAKLWTAWKYKLGAVSYRQTELMESFGDGSFKATQTSREYLESYLKTRFDDLNK
jgi:nucleoside-diphosphate-sugar epimerase